MTRFKRKKVALSCHLCGVRVSTIQQYEEHLRGKNHSDLDMDVDDVLRGIMKASNLPLPDSKVLQSLRLSGWSIPESVRKVRHIDRDSVELKEVWESCLLMDGDVVVGILIFEFFGAEESAKLGTFSSKLATTAGVVNRSAQLNSEKMFMFGTRKSYNQGLDYYSQSVRVGEGRLDGFVRPSKLDLTSLGANLADAIFAHLKVNLGSWVDNCESLVPDILKGFGLLGRTPFTTMGVTSNYRADDHDDPKDIGWGFISWFEKDVSTELPLKRSVFRIPSFGLFFKPRQGSLIAFKPCEVFHGTARNENYEQLGVSLAMKGCVLEDCKKRLETILTPARRR